jgi:hypothetical protein
LKRPLTRLQISPTYRYFLRSKDICVFLAYLQFWYISDTLISKLDVTLGYWDNGKSLVKNQNEKEIEQGIKLWIRNG